VAHLVLGYPPARLRSSLLYPEVLEALQVEGVPPGVSPWWATRINTLSHLAQCMMVPIMDAENVELLANTEIRELMREDA
jgi:hypothetical protein